MREGARVTQITREGAKERARGVETPPLLFYEYFFLPSLSVAGAELVMLGEGEAAVTVGKTAADEVAADVIRALAAHVSLRSKRQLELADGVLLATYVCVVNLALCVVKLARTRRQRAVAPHEVCVVKGVCSKRYTPTRSKCRHTYSSLRPHAFVT